MKTASELIETYGCARSTKGTPENYVRLIVTEETEVPPLTTVAAACGAAGNRNLGTVTGTPRTVQIERWYRSALRRKQTQTRKQTNE